MMQHYQMEGPLYANCQRIRKTLRSCHFGPQHAGGGYSGRLQDCCGISGQHHQRQQLLGRNRQARPGGQRRGLQRRDRLPLRHPHQQGQVPRAGGDAEPGLHRLRHGHQRWCPERRQPGPGPRRGQDLCRHVPRGQGGQQADLRSGLPDR